MWLNFFYDIYLSRVQGLIYEDTMFFVFWLAQSKFYRWLFVTETLTLVIISGVGYLSDLIFYSLLRAAANTHESRILP